MYEVKTKKISEKQSKIIKHLHRQKILFFCVCMCKMSSGAEGLTEERKITAKKYSDSKSDTICVCR